MPGTIPINKIRLALDCAKITAPLSDILSGQAPPIVPQGADLEIDIGLFADGTIASDASNIASLTLEVIDPTNLRGPVLISKTTTAANCTQANWTAGTAQNATFTLTGTDTSLPLLGLKSKDYWLAIWATTTDVPAKRIAFCGAVLRWVDSGWEDSGVLSVAPPGARMSGGVLQIMDAGTNLYYNLVVRTVNGTQVLSVEGPGVV